MNFSRPTLFSVSFFQKFRIQRLSLFVFLKVYNSRFVEERDDYNLQMEAYRRKMLTNDDTWWWGVICERCSLFCKPR
jgi:hypothetical protein